MRAVAVGPVSERPRGAAALAVPAFSLPFHVRCIALCIIYIYIYIYIYKDSICACKRSSVPVLGKSLPNII